MQKVKVGVVVRSDAALGGRLHNLGSRNACKGNYIWSYLPGPLWREKVKLQDYGTTPRLLAQISSQIFLSDPYLGFVFGRNKIFSQYYCDP